MRNFLLFFAMSLFSICLQAQTMISSSSAISQGDVYGYSWPVTINGGSQSNPVIITLAENIFLSSTEHYFIIESEHVEFNGNNFTVSIEYVYDYPGLIQNGSGISSGFDFVTISNIHVASNDSWLSDYGGWIGQSFFGGGVSNVSITNCSSNGYISYGCGGIIGGYSTVTASRCHSTGNISDGAGGIFGENSNGSATNCHSSGEIGNYGGGIFGNISYGSADNCYSTGSIGQSSGGIFGNSPMGTATNCYSTGNISLHGGGILGAGGAGSAVSCYSTGNIDMNAGGIVGAYSSCTVENCYSLGTIGLDAGGISGYTFFGTATNSYFTGGNAWSDNDANINLTDVGTAWSVFGSDLPYKLSAFNEIIYSPDNANVSENTSSSFYPGNFTGGVYSIIEVNGNPSVHASLTINASTGQISVNNSVAGSYVLKVIYSDDAYGSYQINNFTLNVLSTLPVSWRSFTVTARGNAGWLQWSTEEEQNTRDFEVQHSIDGRNWTTVTTLTAAGNSTSVTNYSYLHTGPVNGSNYYRIQQTDRDDEYSYSAVRQLQFARSNKSFSVLNTVVSNGVLQVEVSASTTLYLYNNDGRLMLQKKPGIGLQSIDISTVAKGVYFLKGNDTVEKIVVR